MYKLFSCSLKLFFFLWFKICSIYYSLYSSFIDDFTFFLCFYENIFRLLKKKLILWLLINLYRMGLKSSMSERTHDAMSMYLGLSVPGQLLICLIHFFNHHYHKSIQYWHLPFVLSLTSPEKKFCYFFV